METLRGNWEIIRHVVMVPSEGELKARYAEFGGRIASATADGMSPLLDEIIALKVFVERITMRGVTTKVSEMTWHGKLLWVTGTREPQHSKLDTFNHYRLRKVNEVESKACIENYAKRLTELEAGTRLSIGDGLANPRGP